MSYTYDRELIARMLEAACRRHLMEVYTEASVMEQVRLLIAADNADVHIARRLPPDGIHTCSYQCDQPECIRAQRDELAAQAERDAAEIVRLRGEAESMEQMARMQAARADAAVREVTHLRSIASAEAKGDAPQRCKECMHTTFERRHDGSHICVHCKSIAPQPAEAKTPAPAMPNGVEGLMQLARNWCLAWGEWAHDADPGGAKENAAEAALRAALTTALAKPPAEAFDPSIHPIPGEGPQPAMLNGVEEAEEVLRSALGIARKINQDESGDEWLNLSADLLRLLQKALSPRVGLTIFRAADNRDAAGVDSEEDAYVIERMGKMLAEIAVIVNGPEPDMTRWSYHDLPEKVRALKDAPAAVPAGEAVAYLDIGVGGYLDLGTEKDADELFKLPPGRHMLGIIGTYGVDGYKANPPAAEAPAPVQAAPQPADGEAGAALYGMFRALVDAGGATTVARHGAMPRPEKLMDALTRGMLAIERMFHPERFELDEFPSTAARPPAPVQAAPQEGGRRWPFVRDGERRYSGLGLSNTRRTLREAIDQAALRPSAGEGKGISASHKKHDGPCWRNSHADCGC